MTPQTNFRSIEGQDATLASSAGWIEDRPPTDRSGCTGFYLGWDDEAYDAHGRETVDPDKGRQKNKNSDSFYGCPPQVVNFLDAIKNPGMAQAWSLVLYFRDDVGVLKEMRIAIKTLQTNQIKSCVSSLPVSSDGTII